MAQDFAKRRAPSKTAKPGVPGWIWFVTGALSSSLVTFLVMLWYFAPVQPDTAAVDKPTANTTPTTTPRVIDEMSWDFYEIFPKSEVPIVEEYGPSGDKAIVADGRAYVLQAGSFRSAEDADRQRAQLILLGMDVTVKKANNNGQTWHRVLVGPFHSELELTRSRNILAEAAIETLSLRVPE